MTSFIKDLYRYKKNQAAVNELLTKTLAPELGIVVDTNDPENNRRVKVATAANPTLTSYWLNRIAITGTDEPLPKIGDTVIIFSIEGNEVLGFYIPVQNSTNKPLEKNSAALDRYVLTEGSHQHTIQENLTIQVTGTTDITSGNDLTISTDAEALYKSTLKTHITAFLNSVGIYLESGIITIDAPLINLKGNVVQIPTANTSPEDMTATFSGSFNIVNAESVSINGKQVLTIDSVDSDGDVSVTKGW